MKIDNIEKIVENDLMKIGIDLDDEMRNGSICFSKALGNYAPGNYIYVDKDWIYLVSVGDRGMIEERAKSQELEDVLYEIYWEITARLSTEYAYKNRKRGQDWRRIMFAKRLELLGLIGEQYFSKGKKYIEKILINNPYNDELLG